MHTFLTILMWVLFAPLILTVGFGLVVVVLNAAGAATKRDIGGE